MQIPLQLLESLQNAKGFDPDAFISVHKDPVSITSVRVNPAKALSGPPSAIRVPWSDYGYYLEQRPSFTFDPLFHAGTYYVQEASSMFIEQAIIQLVDRSLPLRVLDLCAAPGGKSTHIQSILNENSLLVSNEVIRSRVNILQDNIIKWGSANVMVTNNDPRDLSRLPEFFDLIVIDAPCSGSGLFRREPEAIDEWSEDNVMLCSQRQQRIISDTWNSLKAGGLLIYSTCSYSLQEDEEIFDWIKQTFQADSMSIRLNEEWNITDTGKGYRFWPDKIKGEGFYLSVFRKSGEDEIKPTRVKRWPANVAAKDLPVLDGWLIMEGNKFIQHDISAYAWPAHLKDDMALILQELRVTYSGVLAGELIHGKLVPAHSLAMSKLLSPKVEKTELTKEMAIRYLQRKDLEIPPSPVGWKLACYQGHPLGWMNVLKNRINNYYPAPLRIRKES